MASVEATSAAKITSTDETNVTEGASNVNGAAVSNLSPSSPPSNEQQELSLKTTPDPSSPAKNEDKSKTETSCVETVQKTEESPSAQTAVTESMEQPNPPNPSVENETPPELPKSEPPQLPPAEETSQEIKETTTQPETVPVSQEVTKTEETNEVSENKVLESPAPPTTTPAEPTDQPVDLTPLNELIQEQPASPTEKIKSQQETKDLTELVTPAVEEKTNETPVTEQPKEQPKEEPQEQPQEQPEETTPDIKETSSTTHVLQKTDSIFNPDRIIEEVTAEGIRLAAQEIQSLKNQETEFPVADSVVKSLGLDEKIPETSSGEQQVPAKQEEATTNALSEAASEVTQSPTETQTSCETEGPKKESEEAKVSDASPPEEEAKKEPDASIDSTGKESQEIPTEPPTKEPEVNANPVDESVTCASTASDEVADPSNTSLDVTN